MSTFYIGVDDTDFGDSIGTGALARELQIRLVQKLGLRSAGSTRHQLFVHPEIPYTSHNSSACVAVEGESSTARVLAESEALIAVLEHPGADPGICAVTDRVLPPEFFAFGLRAQSEVLRIEEAGALAERLDIPLKSLGGSGLGVIGALAACSLRLARNDGRFLSLPGLAGMPEEVSVGRLLDETAIERVVDESDRDLDRATTLETQRWIRPELVRGRIVLTVAEKDGRHFLRKKHDV
jgi:hypothetical protein